MKAALIGFWLSIVLTCVLSFAGCHSGSAAQADPQSPGSANAQSDTQYLAPSTKGIQTEVVRSSPIPEYLDLSAHMDADPTRVVHVFAPAGGRITEMKVRPWDRVAKGQVLATIESSELARAVADYHKAIADDQVKQKALARSEDLLAHNAISEREYQQAQGDEQQSKAEVEAAREQVRVLGADPDHATDQLSVIAPRAGVILDIGASQGEFSQALSAPAPLCTVADIDTIWAVGDIYERDLSAAKSGQSAQVSLNAFPGQSWQGRVSVVSGAVDPATHTLQVRIVLPNAGDLIKPGMFGSIRVLRSSAQGILLPAAAVVREGNDSYVFVGSGNGRFQRRTVRIGRTVDGTIEILSGVQAGDTIVTEGVLLLRSDSGD